MVFTLEIKTKRLWLKANNTKYRKRKGLKDNGFEVKKGSGLLILKQV